MGGVFIVMAILASVSLFADFTNPVVWVLVFTLISLGSLGAYDDYLKLSGKRKGGMRMRTKFLLQMAISVAVGMILHMALVSTDGHLASRLYVPFCGSINLGHLLYPWFVMVVIVATTNAVNITDGLDGLAGGCLGISTFVASGDNGSGDGVGDGHTHVDFPSASPFVVSCGGTTLSASGTTVVGA